MRLLHTSDWHLGAEYHDRPRTEDHERFLAWLLGVVEEQAVEVLVVAGDVFDTGNPSAEAMRLYYQLLAALARLPRVRAAVVVGGNHDSASKLDAPREVLGELRAHVVGGYSTEREGDPAGELIPIADQSGEVKLVVAAVPFLHDYRLGVRGFDASAAEQLESLQVAFRDVYTRLAEQARLRWPGVPAIATGHLTCLPRAGAMAEEGDFPAAINRVGTLGAMGPGIFHDHFRYVALGHIHRGLSVTERVWYSGSPIAMSIDEPSRSRRVLLIDVDADSLNVTPVLVPGTRRLLRLRGSADAVRAELAALTWPEDELPPYVAAEVSVAAQDFQVRARLDEAIPSVGGRPAVLVDVQLHLVRAEGPATALERLPMGEAVTPDVAFRFAWGLAHGEGAVPPDPVLARFQSLLELKEA